MDETTNVDKTISFRVDQETDSILEKIMEVEKRRYKGDVVRVLIQEAIEARKQRNGDKPKRKK